MWTRIGKDCRCNLNGPCWRSNTVYLNCTCSPSLPLLLSLSLSLPLLPLLQNRCTIRHCCQDSRASSLLIVSNYTERCRLSIYLSGYYFDQTRRKDRGSRPRSHYLLQKTHSFRHRSKSSSPLCDATNTFLVSLNFVAWQYICVYKDDTLGARRYIRERALMILRIRTADE